jgi:hypothetical protein
MSDSWEDKITIMVRSLINDLGENPTYTDNKIQQLFVVAAQLLKKEVEFNNTYTMDVVGIDISPDPSDDDAFVTLVSLKTACLITAGELKVLANNSVRVSDASASIDMTQSYTASRNLYEQLCKDFEKAKMAYVLGNLNLLKAIITPYNNGFTGSYPSIVFG